MTTSIYSSMSVLLIIYHILIFIKCTLSIISSGPLCKKSLSDRIWIRYQCLNHFFSIVGFLQKWLAHLHCMKRIKNFQIWKNLQYLSHYRSDKGFEGTAVVNRALNLEMKGHFKLRLLSLKGETVRLLFRLII